MMSESVPALETNAQQRICLLDELPNDTARTFELYRLKKSGRAIKWSIFLVRSADGLVGYVNKCPHQPIPLDWEGNAIVEASAQKLRCGKHGARFELQTGRCFEGPCIGEALQQVALAVVDGAVYVQDVALAPPPSAAT